MIDSVPKVQPPSNYQSRSSAILAVVSLIQLMVIVDTTVVNIALPSIKTALHFSQVDLQWAINAYTLIFAGFLLLVRPARAPA